jgi:capsular polysaccharide transport system permease protein
MPRTEMIERQREGAPKVGAELHFGEAIASSANVMHAVMLRDIRSRYFNHGLGFLIVPLLPAGHVALLLAIYITINKDAAFGDDLVLFFASGLIPVLTANYVSKYMAISILANKNMLSFPVVKLLDIILARSALEFFGIVISILVLVVLLLSLGTDPTPRDLPSAVAALITTAFLGVGVGIVVSVISALFPFFALLYSLSLVVIYLASGGPIYLHGLPDQMVYILSFNPAFQAVDWMRSAYYTGYPTQYLSKLYLVGWALCSVAGGLLMERLLRPKILNG